MRLQRPPAARRQSASARCSSVGAAGQVAMDSSSGVSPMGSAPGCPALQGMVLRPHPWPSLHSAGMPLAQPCPAFIAVASRFVAHASSARSYLRICPRQAVPVRCRPTVWWLCCSCGRCIEFDVCYYLFYPRGVPPRLSRRGHASPPVMSFVLCTAGLPSRPPPAPGDHRDKSGNMWEPFRRLVSLTFRKHTRHSRETRGDGRRAPARSVP